MALVIDNFLAADEACELLEQLPTPLLDEGEERRLLELDVPLSLERRMQRALLSSSRQPCTGADSDEGDVRVSVAARIATGSVPMHQDCFSPFDSAETNFIDGCVAAVYLAGAGSFVVDDGSGEQAIDVVPGRLVAWHNGMCKHRMDARPECGPRIMLGPVAVDAGGSLQRAHDVWSTHPGYIAYCENQSREAERRGDHQGARDSLRNIGIPAVAAERLRELEARIEESEQGRLCLTLTIKQDPELRGGVVVEGAAMDGETIVSVTIDNPKTSEFRALERSLTTALRRASCQGNPAFILSDGTLLTNEHQRQTVDEVFGGAQARDRKGTRKGKGMGKVADESQQKESGGEKGGKGYRGNQAGGTASGSDIRITVEI